MEQSIHQLTSTPASEKDLWETPKPLFNNLDNQFNFTLDACANPKNALCEFYFTDKSNALLHEWPVQSGSVFLNPPYSLTAKFLRYAAEQARRCGVTIVALVNANTDTVWFKHATQSANEIRLISGRISFVKPNGKNAGGNTKGQCIIVWRGKSKTPCNIAMVDRSELMKVTEEL